MRYLIVSLFFLGLGCTTASSVTSDSDALIEQETGSLGTTQTADSTERILPVDGRLIYKGFGEYFEDRFSGYHVAIDLEASTDTPVYAVEDGEVTYIVLTLLNRIYPSVWMLVCSSFVKKNPQCSYGYICGFSSLQPSLAIASYGWRRPGHRIPFISTASKVLFHNVRTIAVGYLVMEGSWL